MWIDRQIEPLLLRRAATRPVVVLTGARQTGKTSLVRRLFPGHNFVSLDLPSEAEQAQLDPSSFLARHPPPLIVDEVQYAPGLFRHLKTVVDQHRDRCGAFLLTGSQPLRLMHSVSESLAGRFHLADAKWTEQLRGRDAAVLRKLLSVLEAGTVASMSIICRAPNAYPVATDVAAVPIDAMPDELLGG